MHLSTIVSLTDPSDAAITLSPNFRPATNDAYSNASHWYEYVGYFAATTDGDYKLHFNKVEGGQQQIVIADVDLRTAETLTISESGLPTYAAGTYPAVTLDRTIKAGFNTFVVPFSMTQDEVEEQFGTGSVVYELMSYGNEVMHFDVSEDGIKANTPCILYATAVSNGIYNIGSAEVADRTANITSEKDGASLVGTYSKINALPTGEEIFVISNGVLYNVDSEVSLKATRAYFNVPAAVGARTISLSFDGITGIGVVENGEVKKVITGEIYDLMGRKVENPSNGIFIVEGKKVVF